MSAQHHFAAGDQGDRDLYARERVLNSAIIAADISRGWDEYLEIVDAFYADEVEVTTDIETGPIRGRARIRALLFNFLAPLHVMVEIGGPCHTNSRESNSWGHAQGDAFGLVNESDRGVGPEVHAELVHSTKVGRLARSVRAPLRPPAKWWTPDWRRP